MSAMNQGLSSVSNQGFDNTYSSNVSWQFTPQGVAATINNVLNQLSYPLSNAFPGAQQDPGFSNTAPPANQPQPPPAASTDVTGNVLRGIKRNGARGAARQAPVATPADPAAVTGEDIVYTEGTSLVQDLSVLGLSQGSDRSMRPHRQSHDPVAAHHRNRPGRVQRP